MGPQAYIFTFPGSMGMNSSLLRLGDAAGLGVREATIHPKATETMEMIIETVKEMAWKAKNITLPVSPGMARLWKQKPITRP